MKLLCKTYRNALMPLALAALTGCAASAVATAPMSVDAGGIEAVAPEADGLEATGSEANGPVSWQTVWADEFDGDALDAARWEPEASCWGGGNNERQCYTGRAENIQIVDGVLRLMARPETFTGPMFPEGMSGAPGGERTQAYTSGKVRTRGLADWTYGRFSARMKLPAGQGAWSAFWMMPSDDAYGPWPLSGEIDIMEAVNIATPCADCADGIERRTSGALHFGDRAPDNTYLFIKSDGSRTPGPSEEWRVYSLEWGEGVLQWLVDGEVFLRISSDQWHTAAPGAKGRPHAPFDQPFYLMLNLAVGGNLAEKSNGGGFDPATFPADLLVDWVRVEQCAGDTETGLACMTDQDWAGEPAGPWEVQAR